MINIRDKKLCCGCNACGDICPKSAIRFEFDHEGFWYPVVNRELCINCGLCHKTCPIEHREINFFNKNIEPECFAANNKDIDVRLDSTSGGVFSALAQHFYSNGGYVGGAIYNDDFSVSHFISSEQEDLKKIRSSKYLQSSLESFFRQVKVLLDGQKKVMVCGAPCQMAGLRLFLQKDYDNLLICDYICRGINSPKVFRMHLNSLERQFDSKIVYAKAKNKELGWKALTFKVIFEDGKKYYGDKNQDNFTRGYLQGGCFCRPSCYVCQFKYAKRIADITLGDFWGVEAVAKELDDNNGTSVVMCNTQKGKDFFSQIRNLLVVRQIEIADIERENKHLLTALYTRLDRNAFFQDLDNLPFDQVANKYFPNSFSNSGYLNAMFGKMVGLLKKCYSMMGLSPRAWYKFFKWNFFTRGIHANFREGHLLLPSANVVLEMHRGSVIRLHGLFRLGFKKFANTRSETRLYIGDGATLITGDFHVYTGCDIQLFPGAKMTVLGGPTTGCNINCQIVCAKEITVGKDVLIGRNVVIRDYDAHYIDLKGYKISAPIHIGSHCWLGDGAMVTKGSSVGNGSIVGARSFLIGKVPSYSLVSGNPAKIIYNNITWRE